jgi:type IX secretion system PorP/SprF family membrane protein
MQLCLTYNKTGGGFSRAMILTFLLYGFLGNIIKAQDIHFSQFHTSPIITNPANTGMSDENTRVAINYRNQWAKIGTPFETFGASIDKKIIVLNQCFGIGGVVLHDKSSAYDLSANEVMLSFSFSKVINNQQITIGLQPGIVSKAFNSGDLTFGAQFDDLNQYFDNTLPNLESGLNEKVSYFDMNVGISWRTMYKNLTPAAGLSINHVNMPEVRFTTATTGKHLPWKIAFNAGIKVPFTPGTNLTPMVLYNYTPGANEFIIGSSGDYDLKVPASPVKILSALAMLRVNPVRNFDALILGCGVGFLKFDLGVSYDFNISPLRSATNFNGAFEISVIYKNGRHGQEIANEPCYIIN